MKTATITIPTHEILIIELTDFLCGAIREDSSPFNSVKGDYKYLGFVTDLNENEVEPLVEKFNFGTKKNYDVGFYDYENKMFFFFTALESFLSLLETKVFGKIL